MPSRYRFVTVWRLNAPLAPVWRAVYDADSWPSWWRGVVSVTKLGDGDATGVGSRRRYVWRSFLPYSLAFDMEATRIEEPRLIEGRAWGELEGIGLWEFEQGGGVTTVRYTWDVRTTRAWMNLLSPLARPIFALNHDYVMRQGAKGLAKLLGTQLIARQ